MISLAELVEESISRSTYFEFGSQGHKVAWILLWYGIANRIRERRFAGGIFS